MVKRKRRIYNFILECLAIYYLKNEVLTSCETSSTTLSDASVSEVDASNGVTSGSTTLLSMSTVDATEGAGMGDMFLNMPK